jgi:hypothetical protein
MLAGQKEFDDDNDFWADHDPVHHGDPEDYIDDSGYAEGFVWSCCEKRGNEDGCKTSRHRAGVTKRTMSC